MMQLSDEKRRAQRKVRCGQQSVMERQRLNALVKAGKANFWYPYRSPEDAAKAAGLK